MKPTTPLLAALLVTVAASPRVAAAAACSNDVFTIDGAGVAVTLCALGAAEGGAAAVQERVTVRGQAPLERTLTIDRVPGSETAHVIDDVPLGASGIARTLHLTIVLRGASVRLEHALLVPGATALK